MDDRVRELVNLLVSENGFRSAAKCHYYFESFFGDVPLKDRKVLEIGCGLGWLCLYAACQGASRVVGLEPEDKGARGGSLERFSRLAERLHLDQVEPQPCTIQDFEPDGAQFDLVLSRSSINHLDEESCIVLHRSPDARRRYIDVLRKIASMVAPGGILIVSDCSRYNFLGSLGIRNPLKPTIEWEKHQPPELWASLLEEVGFVEREIHWTVPRPLTPFGVLTQNRLVSQLFTSGFRMVMKKRR